MTRSSRLSRLHSNLEKFIATHLPERVHLSDEDALTKSLCESSFYEFVKHAWIHVEGVDYIDGWHVQALCEHLEAVQRLEIKKFLCNMPPRVGKSMIINVLFPAWCWIVEPRLRFMYVSYSDTLTERDSVYCRRLIATAWYQRLWGDKFKITRDMDNKHRFDNTKHGFRLASSIGGAVMGQGADIRCIDDPNNLQTVHSPVMREAVKRFYTTFATRFSTAARARLIVNQQRTHVDDLTGYILANNDPSWVFLCLPMEFEKERSCKTILLPMSQGKVWTDPRKKDGELLWPNGIDGPFLKSLKADLKNDSYVIASQFQQRPSPVEGGILQASWFQPWTENHYPEFDFILQSWDTALTSGKMSCFSACTTWGVFKDRKTGTKNIMLLSLFKEQIEYPELRKMAVRLANNYEDVYIDEPIYGHNPPNLILIERQVNGFCMLQDLMRANLPVMEFKPNKYGNKIGRCMKVSQLMENGLVWLPTAAPSYQYYNEDSQMFLEAAINFPEDRGGRPTNDVIVSMSQAFIRLTETGWISNTADPVFEQETNWNKLENKYGNVWRMKS